VSILRHAKPARGRIHPTEKPLSLCEWMVLSYTNPGMTLLDPFMGGAPVGEAALTHGRRFIGIERDPVNFEAASKRLRPLLDGPSLALLDEEERIGQDR
jgi:DNA modification methylase